MAKGEIERSRGRISFFINSMLVKLGHGEGNFEAITGPVQYLDSV
jgi:hypothetical protein